MLFSLLAPVLCLLEAQSLSWGPETRTPSGAEIAGPKRRPVASNLDKLTSTHRRVDRVGLEVSDSDSKRGRTKEPKRPETSLKLCMGPCRAYLTPTRPSQVLYGGTSTQHNSMNIEGLKKGWVKVELGRCYKE